MGVMLIAAAASAALKIEVSGSLSDAGISGKRKRVFTQVERTKELVEA